MSKAKSEEIPVKQYRVRYWHQDGDGGEDYMECDTMDQAQQFYDSLEGMAEIQQYMEETHSYMAVVYPTLEY